MLLEVLVDLPHQCDTNSVCVIVHANFDSCFFQILGQISNHLFDALGFLNSIVEKNIA